MAATVAVLGTSVFSTTAGNKTITATPTVGDLIIIITAATGVATTMADNGTGGTYTQVDSTRTGFSTTGNLQMWVRNNLVSSASSTVYTATQTSSTGGGLVILRVTGMSVAGLSAIRSNGGQNTGTAATTPAPVLSSAARTTNPVIMAVASGTNSTTTMVQRTGYTEVFDNGYATPTTGLEVSYRASGETSATLTAGGTVSTAFASIAAELAYDTAPTVALNAPADAATGQSTTPQLTFTGTDADAEDITYQVQVDTVSTFGVVDSYSETNQDSTNGYGTGNNIYSGQSFDSGAGGILDKVTIQVTSTASPVGSAVIDIFAHSGVYGTSSVATGTALATSDSVNVATLVAGLKDFTFSGANRILLLPSTKYVYIVRSSISSGSYNVGRDVSSASHGGNQVRTITSGASWLSDPTIDDIFYVYVSPSIDKLSNTDTGFTDITNGADADPFASTNQIGYTVQAGDTLAGGTTYYWRVRGKDPSGTNTYGAWATTRSFTTASGASSISVSDTATLTESVKAKFPVSSLIDNFDDNSEDTTKWPNSYNSSATRSEAGGEAVFTLSGAGSNFTAYVSNALDLTGSSAYVKVPTMCNVATNAQAFLQLALDVSNSVRWIQEAGTLYAQYVVAGSPTTAFSVAYNGTTHLWWSIREGSGNGLAGSSGNVYWDTSTDGTTWTNRASVANPIAVNALQVNIGAGTYQVETSPGTARFDNFNTTPAVATPTISVNDTATTSESRTVLIPELKVSTSDTSTLTELVTRQVENRVSTSDTATLTEAISLLISYAVSVSDSSTLSEALQLMAENRISTSDSSTLTESIVKALTPLLISVSDSSTLTETISALSTPNDSVNDTITATESSTVAIQVAVSTSDSSTLSEAVTVQKTTSVSTSDTATITDSSTVAIEAITPLSSTVQDTATLSESLKLLVENRVSLSDSSTLTESVGQVITPYFISVSDSTTITETVSSLSTPNNSIADTTTATESVNILVSVAVSTSDSTTLSESVTTQETTSIVTSDTTNVTESAMVLIAQAGTFNVITSDSTTITETVSAFSTPNDSVSDSTPATESVQVTIQVTKAVSDSTSLSESVVVAIASLSSTGYVKVWNGSSFVKYPAKVWNGSSWQIKPVKYWNGSSWITLA